MSKCIFFQILSACQLSGEALVKLAEFLSKSYTLQKLDLSRKSEKWLKLGLTSQNQIISICHSATLHLSRNSNNPPHDRIWFINRHTTKCNHMYQFVTLQIMIKQSATPQNTIPFIYLHISIRYTTEYNLGHKFISQTFHKTRISHKS